MCYIFWLIEKKQQQPETRTTKYIILAHFMHLFTLKGMVNNYNNSSLCRDTEINSSYPCGTTAKQTQALKHNTRPTCSLSPFYFNTDSPRGSSNFKSVWFGSESKPHESSFRRAHTSTSCGLVPIFVRVIIGNIILSQQLKWSHVNPLACNNCSYHIKFQVHWTDKQWAGDSSFKCDPYTSCQCMFFFVSQCWQDSWDETEGVSKYFPSSQQELFDFLSSLDRNKKMICRLESCWYQAARRRRSH